jgi:hypothetical protein
MPTARISRQTSLVRAQQMPIALSSRLMAGSKWHQRIPCAGYFFENLFEIRPAEIGLGGNLT